ncbi:MAG: glycosyltransferase family 2 protein [Methylococcaceae bacterium]|nr:glycosyltransferase family 2 protein [Methylococcaceae bacterium]
MISLVIPVYNEGAHIEASILKVQAILLENKVNYQFVLVDDGSRDETWQVLQKVAQNLPNIKALKLSRNFGKEAALCAGLEAADGEACIVMDADLQHPPALIPEMIRLWREEGYDVVEGVKSDRGHEGNVYKLGAHLFYSTFNRLSGFDLRRASDFKLMDRKVVDAWSRLPEKDTFFRGMSAWVGFKRYRMAFAVEPRAAGNSKWSPLKLGKLFISAITAFSSLPLQIITFLGGVFFVGSLLLSAQTLYMKFFGIAYSGFTTVILLQLIIGSALMLSLGIIGTYLARIYDEVKNRPRYLISAEVSSTRSDDVV